MTASGRRLRRTLVAIHRWTGIPLAAILVPVALCGAVLAWRAPLDHRLNPELFHVAVTTGAPLDETGVAAAIRAVHPEVRIRWTDLPAEPGHSAVASVSGWPSDDPARRIDEVFVHPFTGIILGTRSSATPRLERRELLAWMHRFHYTLMLRRPGMLFMGGVAIAWLVTSILGAWLTLPRGAGALRRWSTAFGLRRASFGTDLHRAAGLWLWPLSS